MVRIFFHRSKCIGCNACVEINHSRWRISRKDGRCNLIGACEKKGLFRVEVAEEEYHLNAAAAKACPAKIIKVERYFKR